MVHDRATRFQHRLPVRFCSGQGELPRDGCTGDVSASGLFLNTRAVLPEGTHVLGRVELPGGGRAEIHGIVTWSRPAPRAMNQVTRGGMGVRLVWGDEAWWTFVACRAPRCG